jgi:Lar family restriction alleviation protein
MSELKPCPFCGEPAFHDIDPDIPEGYGQHYIACEFCTGNVDGHNSYEDAAEAWNTRAQPTIKPADEL